MSKASLISLTNTALLVVLIILAQHNLLFFDMIWSYQTHKVLHIVGVCMFLGNVFVGPVWLLMALKSKNVETIQFAFKMLLFTDIVVTIPGIDLTVINGLFLSSVLGGVNAQPWLQHAVVALFALWVLVLPILLIQDKMQKLAIAGEIDSKPFKKVFFLWVLTGALSLIPVTYIMILMVFKA
jgi:uncharacterized membrane protein